MCYGWLDGRSTDDQPSVLRPKVRATAKGPEPTLLIDSLCYAVLRLQVMPVKYAKMLHLRVTEEQMQALALRAAADNRSISDWLRPRLDEILSLVPDGATPEFEVVQSEPVLDLPPELEAPVVELGNITGVWKEMEAEASPEGDGVQAPVVEPEPELPSEPELAPSGLSEADLEELFSTTTGGINDD